MLNIYINNRGGFNTERDVEIALLCEAKRDVLDITQCEEVCTKHTKIKIGLFEQLMNTVNTKQHNLLIVQLYIIEKTTQFFVCLVWCLV